MGDLALGPRFPCLRWGLNLKGIALGMSLAWCVASGLVAQPAQMNLAPTDRHVPELARFMARLQLSEPVVCHELSVYSLQLTEGQQLNGNWLSLDQALSRGSLRVNEMPAGGQVPAVEVENISEDDHVFVMAGELIRGGKQTRAVRQDAVLSPGQKIHLSVFCVERHRWKGGSKFDAASQLVPQSISKELRKGASQARIWDEVGRNNRALGAENATGSLELALQSKDVEDRLQRVRQDVIPQMPRGTVGFLFVSQGRAVGAEMYGREDVARALLPKLLDSYAVDFVLQNSGQASRRDSDHRAAIEFYQRMRRVGSQRASTPGSGAGIRTSASGLVGAGVSLSGVVVHYGVQIEDRLLPDPQPIIRVPNQNRR